MHTYTNTHVPGPARRSRGSLRARGALACGAGAARRIWVNRVVQKYSKANFKVVIECDMQWLAGSWLVKFTGNELE